MSPSRRNRGLRGWLAVAGVVLLALACAAAWFWVEMGARYRGYDSAEVFVDIPRGASAERIASLLAEADVIRSRAAFQFYCRWVGGRSLRAGEYRFADAMSPREVYRMLAEGRIYTRAVVIPEGWTVQDITAMLERQQMTPPGEFAKAAESEGAIRDLAPRARNLEGFLFPATYQFPRRISAAAAVTAMTARFRSEWAQLTAQAGGHQNVDALEIVTLASLVETEARKPEERALVAAVYRNRLQRGMALQCDPTVVYALKLAGRWDGRIGYADLKFNSPYNTYINRGLPPGPIANPGAASLRAALAPANVDYLYFVADTQGGHFFSSTLAEHNRNVQKYLRLLAQARREEAAKSAGRAPNPTASKPPRVAKKAQNRQPARSRRGSP